MIEQMYQQVSKEYRLRAQSAGKQISEVAVRIQQLGDDLQKDAMTAKVGRFCTSASTSAHRVGEYLQTGDLEGARNDLELLARQRPVSVAVVGMALGVGIARVAKAGNIRRMSRKSQSSLRGAV